MDATAGAAIGSRRGLGKVKQIDTIFLWVQDIVARKRATVGKVHTSDNFADILTKAVDGPLLAKMMKAIGFLYLQGRSSDAFE